MNEISTISGICRAFSGSAEAGKCLLILGLLMESIVDIRTRKVPWFVINLFLAMGLFWRLMSGSLFTMDTIWAVLPGIFMILGAWLSRGKFGMGDGLMILGIGLYLDFESVIRVILWSFWGAGVLALIVFLIFRKKEMEIPFVPFLFLGYAMCVTVV